MALWPVTPWACRARALGFHEAVLGTWIACTGANTRLLRGAHPDKFNGIIFVKTAVGFYAGKQGEQR
jgi:hypothetical protein